MTCYPSTNVSMNFSFSRLISFIDPLLNISLLPLLIKAYQSSEVQCPHEVFLISPNDTPEEIFRQYPPTFISVGGLDPLLVFNQKLIFINCFLQRMIQYQLQVNYKNVIFQFL